MGIDFGLTAEDYNKYRVQYPDELLDRLEVYGVVEKGQSLLDIGTGTGFLAQKFSERELQVTGVDISKELIIEAKKIAEEKGLNIKYVNSTAESLPFKENQFDTVTAAQCWHWFDKEKVLQEINRVLKIDGKLVIIHLDWLPLKENVVAKTEELIISFNPSWSGGGGNGMYPAWLTQVSEAGYREIETFTFDLNVNFSHQAWRGRIRASAGVGASLSDKDVKIFDEKLKSLLEKDFSETLIIPHRVFCLVCSRPYT
ncbi:class I SAM-dependent methyltransferase [Bacillus safensis]|uniref:class I SAM-dependent methyltransferase n=2 Tax=Bacillus safensis TaxID=561879 RepID=UPI000DAC069B|nr:class I SAM-dependent methyltransferase [Bacillus safensis]MCM2990057.1 class I SAM-dependent methyltransferase [Bacillus safensis]